LKSLPLEQMCRERERERERWGMWESWAMVVRVRETAASVRKGEGACKWDGPPAHKLWWERRLSFLLHNSISFFTPKLWRS
jgi:hypothetical protein